MQLNNNKRDVQLDMYRGLSILYVVCFIHVLYWLNIGKQPFMSMILFEMPVIFFISGASLSFSKNPRPVKKTLKSRFYRLLLPYYIYAAVMVVIVAALSVIWNIWYPDIEMVFGTKAASKYMFNITEYTWSDFVAIIKTTDIPQSPYIWHLWFIKPYLLLSCTFDVQKKILLNVNRGGYLCICTLMFISADIFTSSELLRTLLFYNIFMVMGFCYYKDCKEHIVMLTGFVSAVFVLLLIYVFHIDFCPMQSHKFPPDTLFLFYNISIICILSIIMKRITIPEWKILRIWNERGYTLYLYQSIVFFVVYGIHLAIVKKIPSVIAQAIICSSLIFVISTVVSFASYNMEVKITRFIKNIINYST